MNEIKIKVKDVEFTPKRAHSTDAAFDLKLNIEQISENSSLLLTRIIQYMKQWGIAYPYQSRSMPKVFIDASYSFELNNKHALSILERLQKETYIAMPPGQYISQRSHEQLTEGLTNVELVGTGVYLDLPDEYYALVLPRSGLGAKHQITLANTVGLIDSSYKGEIKLGLQNLGRSIQIFTESGKLKAAQLLIQQSVNELQSILALDNFTDSLSNSERGENGFGSTGV